MLINRSAVKSYVHDRGKRLSKDGLSAVNRAVSVILDRAIDQARAFKTIQPVEVLHGSHGASKVWT